MFKIVGVNAKIQNFPDTFVATPSIATIEINGIKIIKGYITVPEGSGLGVVIDETLFGSPIFSF